MNDFNLKELEDYAELRMLVHEIINQITIIDSINRKLQKGIAIEKSHLETMNNTMDKSKKLVSSIREKIHSMEIKTRSKVENDKV